MRKVGEALTTRRCYGPTPLALPATLHDFQIELANVDAGENRRVAAALIALR